MKNISVVGFMGTGKTQVAKALAGDLEMKYVSLDDRIEEIEGSTISDIFDRRGERYFRKIEKQVLLKALVQDGNVIDTGGGVVIDPENIERLISRSICICLWADPEEILRRTAADAHRPLLNVERPEERIRELMNKRRSFYEKASFHVDTTEKTIEEAVLDIKRIVENA